MQRKHGDTHRLRCAHCGYDLFGLPSRVCPECGNVFDTQLMEAPPDAGLAVAAAALSVGMAVLCVCMVLHMALDEVQGWGGWGGCCRASGSNDAAVLVFLAQPYSS